MATLVPIANQDTGLSVRTTLNEVIRSANSLRNYLYAENSSMQEESMIHQNVGVNEIINVTWCDSNEQLCSGGLWRCYNTTTAVAAGKATGQIFALASVGVMIQGVNNQFQLVPEPGNRLDIRRVKILCDGTTVGQHSRLNDIITACVDQKLTWHGAGLFKAEETINATLSDFDHQHLRFLFGTNNLIELTTAATVTFSIATPTVVSHTAHGYTASQEIYFATTRYLPTGMVSTKAYTSIPYFVNVVDANSYTLSRRPGGTPIGVSDAGTGTHKCFRYGDFYTEPQYHLPCTFTIASPCVVTATDHGLVVNQEIKFSTSGRLPSNILNGVAGGIAAAVKMYVKTVPTADTFTVSLTAGGAAVNTTSALTAFGNHWLFVGTASGTNDISTEDVKLPNGSIRRVGVGMRVAGNAKNSLNRVQHGFAWGDGSSDFATIATVMVFRLEDDDSPLSEYIFEYAYADSVGIFGPLEKNEVSLRCTYCTVARRGCLGASADTIIIHTHASSCRAWVHDAEDQDTSITDDLQCEAIINDNNDMTPDLWYGPGKVAIVTGEIRASQGGLLIDRNSNQGADLVIFKDLTRRQFYGTDEFRRCKNMAGKIITTDADRGSWQLKAPFTTGALGTATVTVFHPGHGLSAADTIRFTTGTTIDGVVVGALERTVTSVTDVDNYVVTGTGAATVGGVTSAATAVVNVCFKQEPTAKYLRVFNASAFHYHATGKANGLVVGQTSGDLGGYYPRGADLGTFTGDRTVLQTPYTNENVETGTDAGSFPTTSVLATLTKVEDGSTIRLGGKGTVVIAAGAKETEVIVTTDVAKRYGITRDAASTAKIVVPGEVDLQVIATTPRTISKFESGKMFTNEGATAIIVFTLPTLPTAAPTLEYSFYVQDADGIRVTAGTGDTIRIAAGVTAAAGNVSSTTIGSVLSIKAINATEWVATHESGTWA